MILQNVSLNRTFEAELSGRFTIEEAARRRNAFLNAYTAMYDPNLRILQHTFGKYQELVSLQPSMSSTLLEGIGADLRAVQEDDTRKALHGLYPSISKIGLVPALRSFTDRFRQVITRLLVMKDHANQEDPLS